MYAVVTHNVNGKDHAYYTDSYEDAIEQATFSCFQGYEVTLYDKNWKEIKF